MFHLSQAHSKIVCLEEYIRDRERQFRSVVGSYQRSESRSVGMGGGVRLRRVGLSHNLLHLRSMLADGAVDESEENGTLRERNMGMAGAWLGEEGMLKGWE